MTVRRHDSARAFLDAVGARLRERPVVNQLPLALAATCITEPERYGPGVRFYSVERAGALAGVALQTPPWPVQVAECSAEAAALLGRAFATNHDPIAGVAGPGDMACQFAAAYAAARGGGFAVDTSLGVFELRVVNAVPAVPGQCIAATADHAQLLQAWLRAFRDEATPHDPEPRPGAGERTVASGRARLWLDEAGVAVSFAFNNRNVEGWASIGPVYTPPAARGHGYATALVAALSRLLLAEGSTGCTLFTNLANPTSNAIYERIGYVQIGTAQRCLFA